MCINIPELILPKYSVTFTIYVLIQIMLLLLIFLDCFLRACFWNSSTSLRLSSTMAYVCYFGVDVILGLGR